MERKGGVFFPLEKVVCRGLYQSQPQKRERQQEMVEKELREPSRFASMLLFGKDQPLDRRVNVGVTSLFVHFHSGRSRKRQCVLKRFNLPLVFRPRSVDMRFLLPRS